MISRSNGKGLNATGEQLCKNQNKIVCNLVTFVSPEMNGEF